MIITIVFRLFEILDQTCWEETWELFLKNLNQMSRNKNYNVDLNTLDVINGRFDIAEEKLSDF